MKAPRPPGLWEHADFRKLWLAQTISLAGSQVSELAIPLTAVVVLQATPVQMGSLEAAQMAPLLLVGLLAGAWVDRLPRRPVLIGSNAGRAVLLGCIPLSVLAGLLGMPALYLVVFLIGVLTVVFDVALAAFLPALLHRDQLVDGNSRLVLSDSATSLLGPALGGLLVQVLTAPVAVAVDAISFLVSIPLLLGIRVKEPRSRRLAKASTGLRGEIRYGLTAVLRHFGPVCPFCSP